MSHPFASHLPSNIENTGLTKMKNYTKTQIRMLPNTTSALHAGDSVVFHLPAAKVLDLATIRFEMNITTAAPTGSADADHVVGLPKYTSALISQLEIIINGVSVQSLMRYNQLYTTIKDYSTDYEKLQQKQFNNADPSCDYFTDNTAGPTMGNIVKYNTYAPTANATVNAFQKIFCIDDFLGLLDFSQSDRQSFWNSNLTGSFEIRFTLSPNSVLWVSDTTLLPKAAEPSYEITNMMGYIDAIEFADSSFVEALDNKLTSTDPSTGERTLHLVPFKNYKSYTGASTGKDGITTMRVVENTSSLDKLLFTYMEEDYNKNDRLQLGNLAAGVEAAAVPSTHHYEYLKASKDPNILNNSKYFKRNATALGYDADRKRTAEIQWELDSQNLHNPMSLCSSYEETKKAFNLDGNNILKCNPGIRNFDTWLKDFFLIAYSLEHVGGQHRGVVVSGVDTMSTAVNVCVKVSNPQRVGPKNLIPMLITESTSILKIGQGRAIAVQP